MLLSLVCIHFYFLRMIFMTGLSFCINHVMCRVYCGILMHFIALFCIHLYDIVLHCIILCCASYSIILCSLLCIAGFPFYVILNFFIFIFSFLFNLFF